MYTDNKFFLIYKEIQKGSGAKSCMRQGFLRYEELRKYLILYEEAVSHTYMTLLPVPRNFLICEENFIVFFIFVKSSI